MKHKAIVMVLLLVGVCLSAQEGLIPAFALEENPLALQRLAQPTAPFDKVGRRFALLGCESGSFEAWAYPQKLLRQFEFSFFCGSSTRPIRGGEIVRWIMATPEATVLTFVYQSFTVRAIFIVPQHEPGALILLEVDSSEPLKIACGFLPVLQPMWPAGMGGQYAYWDEALRGYVISESSRRHHALVGSPAASGLSYTPAHMLSDTPSEFLIDVPDPARVKDQYIPIAIAGGKGKREEIVAIYKRLLADPQKFYRENVSHFHRLQEETLTIRTPVPELDLAFEWAKVALDGLKVDNPDLGSGMVAGLGMSGSSGRPGFGWFFGGDAFINCFSLNGYGEREAARRALAFTQKWQRPDGKMAHELSQGASYIDWFKDYPYAYIHADTTPFYIVAVYDYVCWTGDLSFLKQSWGSLQKAFDWCRSTDGNGDGLMDNRQAGLGGVEYGELTEIETDIYLASVWVEAARSLERLAIMVGDAKRAGQAQAIFRKASRAFDDKFWDEKSGCYVFGFNSRGDKVEEITPTAAIGLMWGLGSAERRRTSLERLCRWDLMTDWGVRSVSSRSRFYQPQNYNYGAVWPFNGAWVASALFRAGLAQQAYGLLAATAGLCFENSLGAVTEVFSGARHAWPQEAVSHQGFSSTGLALPLVRGLLGLDADAQKKNLSFAPQFPADWESVTVDRLRVGEAEFCFSYGRGEGRIVIIIDSRGAAGYSLMAAPGLGVGTRFRNATLDGAPISYEVESLGQLTRPRINLPVKPGRMTLVIEFEPAPEVLPQVVRSRVGDSDQGLKIVSLNASGGKLVLEVEGRAGRKYELGMVHANLVKNVSGAELRNGKLQILFPSGSVEPFLRARVTIDY